MLRKLRIVWRYWPEVIGIILLTILLWPARSTVHRRVVALRRDFHRLDELHERIPSSRASELKSMSKVIEFINAEIPRSDTMCFVGKMKYGIRVKYYTFPREFLPKYHTSTYDKLSDLVRSGTIRWLVFNGVDGRYVADVRTQMEPVYYGNTEAREGSFQRIYRVRDPETGQGADVEVGAKENIRGEGDR